ncbi:MAG: DUF4149 domain-containing protein [Elainella sp. Prado103]|jgi:hypothetical protein|nr:DUF4149 domain-containing protein [Elainella sp. Prado103]
MAATTNSSFSRPKWRLIVLATLSFWLSASLILDGIVMPSLYATGMVTQPGFASAGYFLFETFNHLEVVCAAIVITGILLLKTLAEEAGAIERWQVVSAFVLLAIVLIFTYGLTPEMGALGLQLDQFAGSGNAALMAQMHSSYWVLEASKFGLAGVLLTTIWRQA